MVDGGVLVWWIEVCWMWCGEQWCGVVGGVGWVGGGVTWMVTARGVGGGVGVVVAWW